MTPLEYVVTAAGAAAIVAVGNAIYQALKGSSRTAGDEGPIRVKGGSAFVDAYDDWEPASSTGYKLKNKDDPKWNFWSGRVVLDGVSSSQWNGRIVEVEVEAADGTTRTFTCHVKGGIRITPANALTIDSTDPKRLQNTAVFIKAVRVRGTPTPLDFGPFTAAESKLLEVVLTAQS